MLKRDLFPFDFISHSGNNAKVFRREVVHRVSSFFCFLALSCLRARSKSLSVYFTIYNTRLCTDEHKSCF